MSIQKLRIARVSTVPFFILTQLSAQVDALIKAGAQVTIITSEDELSAEIRLLRDINYIPVNIARTISPIDDVRSLIALIRIFRAEKFDIIHSTTPKAGLLCAIAGRIAGTKIRLHTFTGQPWVTMDGLKKITLKLCDKIIAKFDTHCYTDSFSQRLFLIDSKIADEKNISVLGSGSLAGVDLARFDPIKYTQDATNTLRRELGVGLSSKVILFVGRITLDKGVNELINAFQDLVALGEDVYLIIVGPYEVDGKKIIEAAAKQEASFARIKIIGFTTVPERYMAIADMMCLPSYREGFGTVVIEAAAMGLPTIGSAIYGLIDAIVDGRTGVLVPPGDAKALSLAIRKLIHDPSRLTLMSFEARKRAVDNFDADIYSKLLINEYEKFFQ